MHIFASDWLIIGGDTSKNEGGDLTIPKPNLQLHNLKSVPKFHTQHSFSYININKYSIASTLEFLQPE